MNSKNKEIFLEAAIKIGRKICAQAIWSDNKCTWEIITPNIERPNVKEGKWELANGTLYQGTSGIGLFLLELYKITSHTEFENTCRGAINYAICDLANYANVPYGFHSGSIGILFSAIQYANYLEDKLVVNKIKSELELIYKNENKDYFFDVIGGSAGAILALLIMYQKNKIDLAIELAFNLADNLIISAHKEPIGWSWDTGKLSAVRNLCGYAHGNSGIAHAFLELYNITGNEYYLYPAKQAFLYEYQFYDESVNNWPDFRYLELYDYIYNNKTADLAESLKAGTFEKYKINYMYSWCHGVPGIGLARLRAYELLHSRLYEKESDNACDSIINISFSHINNYSLCHGIGGNCETLITASRVLNNKNYLNIAEEKALEGINKFTNNNIPWACGTVDGSPDPSFMVGESGVGYYLLRLYDDNIPSILFMTTDIASDNNVKTDKCYKYIQENYINEYFGNTLKLIDILENKSTIINDKLGFNIDSMDSDIMNISKYISEYIKGLPYHKREMLEDMYYIEQERLDSVKQIDNFVKEYLDRLIILSFNDIDWDNTIFIFSTCCKILQQKYDWDNLMNNQSLLDYKRAEGDNYYLLFREDNDIKISKITHLSFLIFSMCKNKSNYKNIEMAVIDNLSISEVDVANKELELILKNKIYAAYKKGIIEIVL